MKPNHAFIGHAAADSPLRQIFPNGMCPLKSIHPRMAILGEENVQEEVYLLDLRACDPEEIDRIAGFIADRFNNGIMEAQNYLLKADEFPVRKINITGTSFPHRLIA